MCVFSDSQFSKKKLNLFSFMYGINLCLDCIYNYKKMETVTSKGVTGLHVLYGSAVLILVVPSLSTTLSTTPLIS